jgi:hypothetical protein
MGRTNVTGQLTAYLADTTLLADFLSETELAIIVQVVGTLAANSPAITIHLPRIKLGGASVNIAGEGGQMITAPFQALKYVGSAPGIPVTTIRWHDTEA